MCDYDASHAVMHDVPDDVVVYIPSLNRTLPRVGGCVFISTHLKHTIMYKTKIAAMIDYPTITYVPQPRERQQRVTFHKHVKDGPHLTLFDVGVDDSLVAEMPVGTTVTDTSNDAHIPDIPHATNPTLCIALLHRWNVYTATLGRDTVRLDLHSSGLRVSY